MAALDPLIRRSLQQELKSIFQRLGKTVLLVTHDLGEANFLAERMTLLHAGVVVQTGTYGDLSQRPSTAFVSQFINAQRTLPDAAALPVAAAVPSAAAVPGAAVAPAAAVVSGAAVVR
jgi:osmoprotectant transport system ATP-binding protein